MATSELKLLLKADGVGGVVGGLGRVIAETKKVDKVTGHAGKKMHAFGKEGLTAGNSMRNLAGSIAVVQGPLGPVSGRISALGAIMGRLNVVALASTVAVTALGATLGKVLSVTKDYESQMGKLDAIIKATGGSAGLTSDQIDQFSIRLGENTLASAKGVREAAGALLSFRSISGDTFKQTLTLAQDLAATFGGSLKDKTVQLAKALDDPKRGLDALRRSGVMFTQQQKDQIKVLVDHGEKLKAQKIILDEVNNQVGGAGVGAAVGLSGALDTLGEKWDNLFIATGKNSGVMSAAVATINTVSGAIQMLSDAIDGTTISAMGVQIADLDEKIKSVNGHFKDSQGVFDNFAGPLLKALGIAEHSNFKKEIQALIDKRDELVYARSVKVGKGDFPAYLQAIEAGATAAEASIIALAQAEANTIGRGAGKGSIKAPEDDKKVEREKAKLSRLIEANKQFYADLGLMSDAAFGDAEEKEKANLAKQMARLEKRRDAILNSSASTKDQQIQAVENFVAAKSDLENLSFEKTIAIHQREADLIQSTDEAEAARLAGILDKKQSFLEQIAAQAEEYGLNAADAEQVRYETDVEKANENFQTSFEALRGNQAAQEELTQTHLDTLNAMEELHAKKTSEIKANSAKQDRDAVANFFGDVSSLMQTGNRRLFEIGKAAAIAQAIVKGISSVLNSYEKGTEIGGPILGAVFAAAAAVATGVQISKLASTTMNGGGSVSAGGASFSTPAGGTLNQVTPVVGFNPNYQAKPTTPSFSIVQHITAPNAQIGAADAIQQAANLGAQQAIAAVSSDFGMNGPLRQQLAV